MEIQNFNLIVSTPRHREDDASDELLEILQLFGDVDPELEITPISGLVLAKTKINPLLVIEELKALVKDEPWRVRYIMRVLPVDIVLSNDIAFIQLSAKKLSESRMVSSETFRVTLEKRHCSLSSTEIIEAAAGGIEHKVDLHNPDWILLVEVLGKTSAISLLRPSQIFSSIIEKRSSGR